MLAVGCPCGSTFYTYAKSARFCPACRVNPRKRPDRPWTCSVCDASGTGKRERLTCSPRCRKARSRARQRARAAIGGQGGGGDWRLAPPNGAQTRLAPRLVP